MAKASFFSIKEIISDRRKLVVFMVCLAVSLLSWILISLAKEYSTTYIVPVRYVNFPENKTMLNRVPNQLAVSVSGSGFELLQFDNRLTSDTLPVNLDNLNTGMYGAFERGYLDQTILSKDLQERLKGALRLNRVLTDSIYFVFDLKVARTIPVKPQVTYSLKSGLVQLDSITVEPSEVEVYGALSLLDTMKFIKTATVDLGELGRSLTTNVPISKKKIGYESGLTVDSVRLIIEIDQLTEKSFLVQPRQLHVPDSLDMLTFPNSVEVTAQLPLSKYDDMTAEDLEITVDYDDIEEGFLVLPIHLEKWPSFADQIRIRPEQVEIVMSIKE